MKVTNENYTNIEKTEAEVKAYLAKLKYALTQLDTIIKFQIERQVDKKRPLEYTNAYTVADLFPDESPKEAMKRELNELKVIEYMETVKDKSYPNRSDLWVFGKKFNSKDTYIKFRVEIVQRNNIFVMSFHFSTIPFAKGDFPFADS